MTVSILDPAHPDLIAMYTMDNISADGKRVIDEVGLSDAIINSGTQTTGVVGQAWQFDGKSMGGNTYEAGLHLNGQVMRPRESFFFSCVLQGRGIVVQSDYYGDFRNPWGTGWGLIFLENEVRFQKGLSRTSAKTVTAPVVYDGDPIHIGCWVDHQGICILYANGQEVGRGDISGAKFYNGRTYANTGENIGAAYNANFLGFIDEVRVFSVLPSADDIQTLASGLLPYVLSGHLQLDGAPLQTPVRLYGADGTLLDSLTTDVNGFYQKHLPTNEVVTVVPEPPAGYAPKIARVTPKPRNP